MNRPPLTWRPLKPWKPWQGYLTSGGGCTKLGLCVAAGLRLAGAMYLGLHRLPWTIWLVQQILILARVANITEDCAAPVRPPNPCSIALPSCLLSRQRLGVQPRLTFTPHFKF